MSHKTKAYRKISDGYELITSKYILSLGGEEEQRMFIDNHKPFWLEPSDDGLKLTFNVYQKTFSFYGGREDAQRFFGSNENSATHQYCIEELAKFNQLTVTANNDFADRKKGDLIDLTFNYAFPEIVLEIGETYVKPDLLLYIREPYDLALRWNRLLAIEVVVAHDLNGEKLELMQDAKIPILRIKANKKWGRKKEDEMSEKEQEKLRSWIKNTFKKGYTGDFLLDAKSKAFLENETIQLLDKERQDLQSQVLEQSSILSQAGKELKRSKSSIESLGSENHRYKTKTNQQAKKIQELDGQNTNLTIDKKKLKKILFRASIVLISLVLIESLIIYFLLQ